MSDRAGRITFLALGAVPAAVVALVVAQLLVEAWPVLADGRRTSALGALLRWEWSPSHGSFGILPMLLGTVLTAALAVLVGLAMSLSCAVVVHYFLRPTWSTAARQALTILAGIPSVLYGLWGLTLVVPLLARVRTPGLGLGAVALVLAVMITPTMALAIESGFFAADAELGRAATALGLSRATTVFSVVVPACRGSIAGGMMIGLARAIGETMVVLMLAGNVINLPLGLFEPYRTLSSHIALEVGFAMGEHRAALFAAALVLAATVVVLVRLLAPRVRSSA